MSTRPGKRRYQSPGRAESAAATRDAVLAAAKGLFARRGIDAVTIAEIAKRAGVSVSTVYGLFESKEGLLRAWMETILFGDRYRKAAAELDAIADPTQQIAKTATIARAIYDSEWAELGLLRGAASFSRALRKLEHGLETMRYELQEARVTRLYAASKAKKGLSLEKARRLLWMYTSRDLYRLLVQEGGWSSADYEKWLADTLVATLVR
jgi:AcrR family transcriptional regulator